MKSATNLIKNGNFTNGDLPPWYLVYGKPEDLVFRDYQPDKKVVLLEPAEVLEQRLDIDGIGHPRTFVINVTARASPDMDPSFEDVPHEEPVTLRQYDAEHPPELNNSLSWMTVSLVIGYPGGQTTAVLVAEVSTGLQHFTGEFVFSQLPGPIAWASLGCRTAMHPLPPYDRRRIWVTGFEVYALE